MDGSSAHIAKTSAQNRTNCGAATGASATHAVPLSPLLRLPRELRDHIYNYIFLTSDLTGDPRGYRIERRHLRHFKPYASSILLLLRYDSLLLSRQICSEALEVLFKNHTVYLSCGPFVLKKLLEIIEENGEYNAGKTWLRSLKSIELNWITFPNLRSYPPNRENGKDEWWWENDGIEVDVDYIRGAEYSGHYDEYDYEGSGYDDNLYGSEDPSLYPTFPSTTTTANLQFSQPPDPADPFGFSTHYPFADPSRPSPAEQESRALSQDEISSKLELLIDLEVAPLFAYLSTPTFALTSITIPLYFISRRTYHQRNTSRPGFALPLKLRFWVHVAVHALLMLHDTNSSANRTISSSPLREVRIKYMPSDIWTTMDPADDLPYLCAHGVWPEDPEGDLRDGESEAFRGVWIGLKEKGVDVGTWKVGVEVDYVKWDGGLDDGKVGDELDIRFRVS